MNKTIITGRLGGDPEETQVGSGSVVKFSVAVNEYDFKSKQQVTVWYRVSTWMDRTKKFVMRHMKKGSAVEVEGSLEFDPETGAPRVWTGRDGVARSSFELRATDVSFAPTGGGGNSGGKYDQPKHKAASTNSGANGNYNADPSGQYNDDEIVF